MNIELSEKICFLFKKRLIVTDHIFLNKAQSKFFINLKIHF